MPQDRLTRMEVTLFGPTGDNGVVGTQKKLVEEVRELRQLVTSTTLVLRTIKWVALAAGTLAATFKAETLAEIVRAIAGIAKLSG